MSGHGLLENRVVAVTGGGRGIGASISEVLASEGAKVAVLYSVGSEAALATVEGIRKSGGEAEAFQVDVRDARQVEEVLNQVANRFSRLDGLVNNAIAGTQDGAFLNVTEEEYRNSFDFGCIALVNTIKASLPHFQRANGGRVVNIVTELWNMAPAGWSVYLAGKGAMVGLSRSLAEELGPQNVTVNMVAPGWMVTEKVDPESEGSKAYGNSLPLRHQGHAREIGNACSFLLSDLAGFVTGAYIPVTGGRVTQMGA